MTILNGDIVSIILDQWHWKVILNSEYWWYLDIPNLQIVELPFSFHLFNRNQFRVLIDWLIGLDWISSLEDFSILADLVKIIKWIFYYDLDVICSVINHWWVSFWLIVCLFHANRFLFTIHISMNTKISSLSHHAVFLSHYYHQWPNARI